MLDAIVAEVRDSKVRLSGAFREGQRVVVIALPASTDTHEAPPLDLLQEDAAEFAPRAPKRALAAR